MVRVVTGRGRFGQVNLDCSPLTRPGANSHLAGCATSKAIGLAETETRSPADLFCGEERIEGARRDFRCHAGTVVAYRDQHVSAGGQIRDFAPVQNRITRLDYDLTAAVVNAG